MPQLHLVRDFIQRFTESLANNPIEISQSVLGFASSFLLSLLFSFLIVLDLQKIQRGIQGLSNTKIGFIYDEVADNIAGFGRVLGRALEAQLFIAICNTILTAIGVWMMGLPNLLVLSAVVFFCSFISEAVDRRWPRAGALLRAFYHALGALLLAILLYALWPEFVRAWTLGDYIGAIGNFTAPTWPVRLIMVVGAAVTIATYLLLLAIDLSDALRRRGASGGAAGGAAGAGGAAAIVGGAATMVGGAAATVTGAATGGGGDAASGDGSSRASGLRSSSASFVTEARGGGRTGGNGRGDSLTSGGRGDGGKRGSAAAGSATVSSGFTMRAALGRVRQGF